jgi:hypothetical protein
MQEWHWGHKLPIHYISKQDPIQDAFVAKHKPIYVKLALLKTGSEIRVARWDSGTSTLFTSCVVGNQYHQMNGMGCTVLASCQSNGGCELGLGHHQGQVSMAKQEHSRKEDNEPSHLSAWVSKTAQDKLQKKEIKKKDEDECIQLVVMVMKTALNDSKARNDTIRVQIFQLYANLLMDEVCQPWDRLVKAQTNTAPLGLERPPGRNA